MVIVKKLVVASLLVEGTHNWDSCNKAEVNYLANEHRHMFHIKVYKAVEHNDREVEIIKLKHKVRNYINSNFFCEHKQLNRFGSMSCEMLAELLIMEFGFSACEVLEDGENGAHLIADNFDD